MLNYSVSLLIPSPPVWSLKYVHTLIESLIIILALIIILLIICRCVCTKTVHLSGVCFVHCRQDRGLEKEIKILYRLN